MLIRISPKIDLYGAPSGHGHDGSRLVEAAAETEATSKAESVTMGQQRPHQWWRKKNQDDTYGDYRQQRLRLGPGITSSLTKMTVTTMMIMALTTATVTKLKMMMTVERGVAVVVPETEASMVRAAETALAVVATRRELTTITQKQQKLWLWQ